MRSSVRRVRFRILGLALLVLVGSLLACDGNHPDESETISATLSATEPPTESETEPATEPPPVVYYICLYNDDPAGSAFRTCDTAEEAISLCKRVAQLGYRVVSSEGEVIHYPYTELQCDILRECKEVTDYVRDNEYHYGDAARNPAMVMPRRVKDRKVSCDRFACWALYNVGFTDQPSTQGVVVSRLAEWCEANGFERIDREEDLQPGDVVLVRFNGSYPAHTFIYAGPSRGKASFRYDCGSDTRIQSNQPSSETITDFWRAYRPVADSPSRETGEFKTIP